MTGIVALDGDWRSANPLPTIESGSDKNSRGRVLLVGGARFVPGALALTGEAVLRAGAGKLQMATVEAVASALGVLVPEAAMVGLPMREDGEIAQEGVAVLTDLVPQCDVLLVGPPPASCWRIYLPKLCSLQFLRSSGTGVGAVGLGIILRRHGADRRPVLYVFLRVAAARARVEVIRIGLNVAGGSATGKLFGLAVFGIQAILVTRHIIDLSARAGPLGLSALSSSVRRSSFMPIVEVDPSHDENISHERERESAEKGIFLGHVDGLTGK